MIELRNVTKAYGHNEVLKGLSLEVRPGERVALIGPSGSGKTTVLRVLMGLTEPSSGDVIINGANLWKMKRKEKLRPANEAHLRRVRSNVGMIFQHFNLFPHMTALENVAFAPRKTLGMSRIDANKRAAEYLREVGLGDRLSNKPAELSGGQQQRVAIARAFALKPKVMLFDEVTSALDPELVNEVLHVIRTFAETTSTTMLLVTHEMQFAADVATRIVMFDNGLVIEDGRPENVLRNPSHERTQRFLESILTRTGR